LGEARAAKNLLQIRTISALL